MGENMISGHPVYVQCRFWVVKAALRTGAMEWSSLYNSYSAWKLGMSGENDQKLLCVIFTQELGNGRR